MKVTKEDFDAWRDNHVTEEVFRALRALAETSQRAWMSSSWDGGKVDPQLLADLRARAQIANDICELTHEELEKMLEQ